MGESPQKRTCLVRLSDDVEARLRGASGPIRGTVMHETVPPMETNICE